MELTSEKIVLNRSITDESFNGDSLSRYRLFIEIGNDSVAACVLDSSRKKFIALEDFHFNTSKSGEDLAKKCELVKQESKLLLTENYGAVNCCVTSSKSTLVPEPLYKKESEGLFLKFNFSEETEQVILADNIKLLGAKNLFAVPVVIEKMLKYWHQEISIHHHSTAFIKSLLIENKNKNEKTVSVLVHSENFDIAVTASNKLIFYNSFAYKTNEDFLYFILFIMEQLQLNPDVIPLTMYGNIERRSALFESADKYIKNVFSGERPSHYNFSYGFDKLPPPSYYNLFNQYLCEL